VNLPVTLGSVKEVSTIYGVLLKINHPKLAKNAGKE
jgi:hypothetical protein